ncbi:MAG TPA: hypothetical protein VFN74_00220 [Chloroflexota bacterium]|nr:hypothetical protein [Chloroflexota bacterium]
MIEIGAASARLLIADRRPAHAIPLWDDRAPAPADTHGYELRPALEETLTLDGTPADPARPEAGVGPMAQAVAQLVKRAEGVECADLQLVAEIAPASGAWGLDAAQAVARAVGRPVHLLTPHRASELFVLGASEALDPTVETLLVRYGGSTTDVALSRARRRAGGAALPVGPEELATRHSDPPREGELKALRHRVRATLRALPAASLAALVVCAGVGEPLALLPALAGVEAPSGTKRSRTRDAAQTEVTLAGVRRALRSLQSTHSARLARSSRIPQSALRRLPTAALILEALMEHCGLDVCRLTPRGLRHGVLIAAAEDPQHWWVDLEAARLRRERLERVSPHGVTAPAAPHTSYRAA